MPPATSPRREALPGVSVAGSIVLVMKCPIMGKSKACLIPITGIDGSAHLVLANVLMALTFLEMDQKANCILLFSPPTDSGHMQMESLLDQYNIPWQPANFPIKPLSQDGNGYQSTSDNSHNKKKRKKKNSKKKNKIKHHHHHNKSSEPIGWNLDAWLLLAMSSECIDDDSNTVASAHKCYNSPVHIWVAFWPMPCNGHRNICWNMQRHLGIVILPVW